MLTANEIRSYELRKGAMGGYRAEDVEILKEDVAVTVEQLTAQNQESLKKIEVLAQKIEEYRQDEASIHEALLKAQKMADQLLKDAKQEAEKVVAEAEKKASEIINSAQFKADSTISEAEAAVADLATESKAKAEQLLTNASLESETMLRDAKATVELQLADAKEKSVRMMEAAKRSVEQQQALFDSIKGEIGKFRANILSLYAEQVEKVKQIPDFVPSDPKTLAEIIAAQPVPVPGAVIAPQESADAAEPAEPEEEAAAPAEEEISVAEADSAEEAAPAEEAPAEPETQPFAGGFRIMVDDEDDEDEPQATLTFGDEESTQGFVFKK